MKCAPIQNFRNYCRRLGCRNKSSITVPRIRDYLNTRAFRKSLGETIAWCSLHAVPEGVVDPGEMQRRRQMLGAMGQLIAQAHERVRRSWFRWNATASPEWRRAMEVARGVQSLPMPGSTYLRSPGLNPSAALDEVKDEAQRQRIVEEVVKARAQLLRGSHTGIAWVETLDLAGGRLLLYFPAENLADGAAEVASGGVFDVNNVPPWDTWVAYTSRTLISWIPPWLESLVEDGIKVNPEQCICWDS